MINDFEDIRDDEYIENLPEIRYRLHYLFISLVMFFFVLYLPYEAINEILNLQGLFQGKIYIYEVSWAIPSVLAIPVFLLLSYMCILKFFQRLTEKSLFKFSIIIIILGICVLVLNVIFGFGNRIFITNKGYSYCDEYSGHGKGAGVVYVRDSAYCLENSRMVRWEIMEWIDTQVAKGKEPTVEQVQYARHRLLKKFKQENPYYKGPSIVY